MKTITPILINCFCTSDPGSGNTAAVFIDNPGDKDEKLRLAAKLNSPVTVFVSDSASETPVIEFYYPEREMKLCLHGTLAAGKVLLTLKKLKNIRFSTKTRQLLTVCQITSDSYQVKVSAQNLPYDALTQQNVIDMLKIDPKILLPNLPFSVVSVGSPKLLIPVGSLKMLLDLKLDFRFIKEWSLQNNINGLYVYTPTSDASIFDARGFNPKTGHNEDAATGVAAGALSLALKRSIIVNQGNSLNIPCSISVTYHDPMQIWIGGNISECARGHSWGNQ
jgi:PhzF family phenazine biosynthesis protein